ncbi:hypothetical protein [Streptomyces sp. NPDC005374]|uniref:hypothetical protein n=1 Tax=Streptomyces sp. NPDC005374 TaxID=3364713 RepID=UPI0036A09959
MLAPLGCPVEAGPEGLTASREARRSPADQHLAAHQPTDAPTVAGGPPKRLD